MTADKPPVHAVGALLALPDPDPAAVAHILRQLTTRPWGPLLTQARVVARTDYGAGVDLVREAYDRVHELMAATEPLLHRIVMVIDDVAALARSWHADADTAGNPARVLVCRHAAAAAVKRGPGRHAYDQVYRGRAAAVPDLDRLRDAQRPGQSFYVEPLRRWTPDHVLPDGARRLSVKRACNGCGYLLGDVTAAELDRAVAGVALSDVRVECPACSAGAPPPGRFCEQHFSWLCQAGQARCQAVPVVAR